jgi:hypothetical protein
MQLERPDALSYYHLIVVIYRISYIVQWHFNDVNYFERCKYRRDGRHHIKYITFKLVPLNIIYRPLILLRPSVFEGMIMQHM